jgi:hypothetical protein
MNEIHLLGNFEKRYQRDEYEDYKTAIDFLFEFKKKLKMLHPNVEQSIRLIMQQQSW